MHLIEDFPKEERLPPLIINYAVISRDFDFYKHLVNSQIEQYNSGKEKHSLDVMPIIITPIQNSSDKQQKDDVDSRPEQTLEYIRLLVQCSNHLEVKYRALMKIEHCFPHLNFNPILCP